MTVPRVAAGFGLALAGWVLTLLGGKLVAWHEDRGEAGLHDNGPRDVGEASVAPAPPTKTDRPGGAPLSARPDRDSAA